MNEVLSYQCPLCNCPLIKDKQGLLSCEETPDHHTVFMDSSGYDINIVGKEGYRYNPEYRIQSNQTNREYTSFYNINYDVLFQLDYFIPIHEIKPHIDRIMKLKAFL